MRQIEITVPLKGLSTGASKITVETSGYKGNACQQATMDLLGKLGGDQDATEKAEMYEDPLDNEERLTQGGE